MHTYRQTKKSTAVVNKKYETFCKKLKLKRMILNNIKRVKNDGVRKLNNDMLLPLQNRNKRVKYNNNNTNTN